MPQRPTQPDDENRIGEVLRRSGLLTDEQLEEALREQGAAARPGHQSPVGHICAQHGWCTMADLAAAVRQQHEAVFRGTTLGHLLVDQGCLTLEQLEAALDAQAELRAPLGEILINKGFCSRERVLAAVDLQNQRRNASLRHLTAAAFDTFNVTEIVVNQELDAILRQEGVCTCDECRANALAIALNSLPPRYVSDPRLLRLFVERFRVESLELIRQRIALACRQVKTHPKSQCRRELIAGPADAQAPRTVPVNIRLIDRYALLTPHDVEALFGRGCELTHWIDASQAPYFATHETIRLAGPKGTLERVRVVGPPTDATRVEVTGPDLFVLGQPAPDATDDSAEPSPITLVGPQGSLEAQPVLCRIAPHVHASAPDAQRLALHDGQRVRARLRGKHSRVLDNVPIRIHEGARLELHVPVDEAACEGLGARPSAELLLPERPED